jgi:hypothetical protein
MLLHIIGPLEDYTPDAAALLEGQEADQQCGVDLALPELSPAYTSMDFEQEGLEGWEVVSTKFSPRSSRLHVARKCDRHHTCETRQDRMAYQQGDCYAHLSAGDTQLDLSEPNSIKRYDFRVPGINQSCASQLLQLGEDASDSSEHRFSFAMRFDAKDFSSQGKNDFFQVKVVMVDNGNVVKEVLFDRTIRISDVGDKGDSGWEVHQVPLPSATIGTPIYFGMEATVTNVGDYGLDSIGMLDDLNIGPVLIPIRMNAEKVVLRDLGCQRGLQRYGEGV